LELKKKAEHEGKSLSLPLAFITFLVVFGAILLLIAQENNSKNETLETAVSDECILNYGKSECIDNKLSIPFYNAGKKTIISAQITIPVLNGIDTANISESLEPKKTGAVQLTECKKVDNSKPLNLKWCCEKCYETEMNIPSENIVISG